MRRGLIGLIVGVLFIAGATKSEPSSEGFRALLDGDFERALPLLEKEFQTRPTEQKSIMISDCHRKMGHYYKALEILNQSIVQFGESWQLLGRRCVIYDHLTDRDGTWDALDSLRYYSELGIADMNRSIQLDSSRAWSYYTRSIFYVKLNELEKALIDLDKAIELDRRIHTFYRSRSKAHHKLGHFDLAEKDAESASRLWPDRQRMYTDYEYRDLQESSKLR